MYAANSYPIYVVIDREGNIVAIQHGSRGEGPLRSLLARAALAASEEQGTSAWHTYNARRRYTLVHCPKPRRARSARTCCASKPAQWKELRDAGIANYPPDCQVPEH